MRLVKVSQLSHESMGEGTPIPGWAGGSVPRSKQTVIPDGASKDYSCALFHFQPGATTGWHSHSCDQILIITQGAGVIETDHAEQRMTAGDIVLIEAGERHWHGAVADAPMSHLAI